MMKCNSSRVNLHHQFIDTPEANDNGAEHWPQVTTLLRCGAFLNRVDCLLQPKDMGANMVSGHNLQIHNFILQMSAFHCSS
jgi:hypothetical protein